MSYSQLRRHLWLLSLECKGGQTQRRHHHQDCNLMSICKQLPNWIVSEHVPQRQCKNDNTSCVGTEASQHLSGCRLETPQHEQAESKSTDPKAVMGMELSYQWCMPDSNTFRMPPVIDLLKRYVQTNMVVLDEQLITCACKALPNRRPKTAKVGATSL